MHNQPTMCRLRPAACEKSFRLPEKETLPLRGSPLGVHSVPKHKVFLQCTMQSACLIAPVNWMHYRPVSSRSPWSRQTS